MKKLLASILVLSCVASKSFSQNNNYVRPTAIGISFNLVDLYTAERIQDSRISTVLANKSDRAKFKDMSLGLGLSYFKGLSNHLDFAGTLSGVFIDIPLEDRTSNNEMFFLQADASINLKLLSDKYIFTPYLSAGAGVSNYGKQFGAFIPAGIGVKFNFLDEAAFFINSQYRIPVTTDTYKPNVFHAIGIAGTIGK